MITLKIIDKERLSKEKKNDMNTESNLSILSIVYYVLKKCIYYYTIKNISRCH